MTQSTEQKPVSGDTAVLARRYAEAFYELASDEKSLDAVATDLRRLQAVTQNNPEFISLSNHPRLTRNQMVEAAETLATTLKLSATSTKFVSLVAQRKRLSILNIIITAFLNKLAADKGEFTANVTTASPLTQQQTDALSTRLATLAGGKVHLNLHEDKSLIGGLTVQLGSRLIDASIKSKLQRLERKLKSEAA